MSPVKDDWSSALENWAEKEGHEYQEIIVLAITLSDFFDEYCVPYYIKCDIEGADRTFTEQLLKDGRMLAFVSVES